MVILLEGLAVRGAPEFPREAVVRLREVNAARESAPTRWPPPRTTTSSTRSSCAAAATTSAPTLRPLNRLLLRYEYNYMAAKDFVSRSVHRHEEIIQALERGDRDAASALVKDDFRDSLPGILEQL